MDSVRLAGTEGDECRRSRVMAETCPCTAPGAYEFITKADCFAINSDAPGPVQVAKQQRQLGGTYTSSNKGQLYTPGGRRRKLNRVCPLFNKARAACHYGEECIYVHRCSGCKKEDHGKYSSVNDGISSELCSLLCISVDDISRVVAALNTAG